MHQILTPPINIDNCYPYHRDAVTECHRKLVVEAARALRIALRKLDASRQFAFRTGMYDRGELDLSFWASGCVLADKLEKSVLTGNLPHRAARRSPTKGGAQ